MPHKSRLKSLCFRAFWILVASTGPISALAEPLPGLTLTPTSLPTHFKLAYHPDPDKEIIEGLVAFPKGLPPYRSVILVHGAGSDWQRTMHSYSEPALQRGYAVITLNLSFARQVDDSDMAEIFRRLSACVDIARNDERFDSGKIYMYGHGAGAMAIVAYLAQTDKIKAAAVSGAGVLPKGGVPYEKISAPLMILHGEKDQSVPLEAAQQLKSNLDKAGKEASLKIYPGSGHELPMMKTALIFDDMTAFFKEHEK